MAAAAAAASTATPGTPLPTHLQHTHRYVYTLPSHKGHEIQIAFLIGSGVAPTAYRPAHGTIAASASKQAAAHAQRRTRATDLQTPSFGSGVATLYFDDIQLYEADVPSPPPPSPPPPPRFLLWLDGEGGPGVQTVVRQRAAAR